MTDYTSVDAKLGRAVEHLDGFRSELEAWYATDPMHVVSQPNPDRRSADLYFQVSNPMPSTLNVLLGDSVHNLRSALDHLAMALAVDNGANPYDRFISFPICKDFKAFHGHDEQQPPRPPEQWPGANKIRALRPAAQAFIEGLQPKAGRDMAWTLWELQELDNRDKHRTILDINPEAITTLNPAWATILYEEPLRLRDYVPGHEQMPVLPFIPACVAVERSNRLGWLNLPTFVGEQVLPYVRSIIKEAKQRFP
jgi:hypothetical protein